MPATMPSPNSFTRREAAAETVRPNQPDQREAQRTAPKPGPARSPRGLSFLVHSVALVGLGALVFGTMLAGHIQIAFESHRSVVVTGDLAQARNESSYWVNTRARLVTPTTVSQKAAAQGMVHPDESATVPLP